MAKLKTDRKECVRCHKDLHHSMFYNDKREPDGVSSLCIQCTWALRNEEEAARAGSIAERASVQVKNMEIAQKERNAEFDRIRASGGEPKVCKSCGLVKDVLTEFYPSHAVCKFCHKAKQDAWKAELNAQANTLNLRKGFWTPAEDKKLRQLKGDGIKFKDMIPILKRPYSSIMQRWRHLQAEQTAGEIIWPPEQPMSMESTNIRERPLPLKSTIGQEVPLSSESTMSQEARPLAAIFKQSPIEELWASDTPISLESPILTEEPTPPESTILLEEPVSTESAIKAEEPIPLESPIVAEQSIEEESVINPELAIRRESTTKREPALVSEGTIRVEQLYELLLKQMSINEQLIKLLRRMAK